MTEKLSRKKRVLKWVLSILLLLSLTIMSASWYISKRLEPSIRKELDSLVKRSTHGLYHLEYSTITTNLISGTATINDVVITPDTLVYQQQILQKVAPNNLYYISLKKLSIKRFRPLAMYLKKDADVELLLFDRPNVTMVNRRFDFNENRKPQPLKSPYSYIAKLFNSLRIETVDFKDANFKYVNNNQELPEIDSVANLNVKLKDWLIDKESANDTSRIYLLKDVEIGIDDYRFATPDSMYYLKVQQLDYTVSTGKLKIRQFDLEPRYPESTFAKVNGYSRDRYFVQLNNLELEGINLPAYIQKQQLIAKVMNMSDGEVSVYNDNSYPKRESVKTGKFPHQLLQKVRPELDVRQINLQNIDVSYAEYDRDSKQVGKITFENTSGTIINATNMASRKHVNSKMEARLKSDVMGQGKLDVNFVFDLHSSKGQFSYSGSLTQMEGKAFNRITKPLGMLQVNKGVIDKLAFDINADEDLAKGKLDFRYHDLSVALMKKEEGRDRLVRQGLISLLANALVIYADNPSLEGKFTSANIHYKREVTASFFNFIWRSLFQGVKYSVGVSPQREAEIRAQIRKFEKMKQDREARRNRRIQRKELRN